MKSIRDGDATVAREGGCLCGAVRYRVKGEPVRSSACHCTYCQRRTGSAFGVGAYFRENDVEIMRGDLKAYEYRSDESGRWLRPARFVWMRSAHPWVVPPHGMDVFQEGTTQPARQP